MINSILVITELFLPTKGGTAVWFDKVYQLLGGKNIHIITAKVPGAENHDKNHKNTIHRIDLLRFSWLKPESLIMYLKLLWNSFQLGLKNRFQIVHAGRVLPEGFVGYCVAKLFNIPLIIYAHGEEITTWRQPVKLRVMTYTYRQADKIIANSEFTKQELLKIGVLESRIVILSPGVDVECFKPGVGIQDLEKIIGGSGNFKLLLSVGRLTRRKGFDHTIKALSNLKKMGLDVHYAIIGIGEDKFYLEQLAQDKKIVQNVHFLGHVSEEDLPKWYNAADLLVMPNREINGDTEGFGMVFLEANACGKPVIAGIAGGTGGAVIDGKTGFRIDGLSVEELTNCIYKILVNKDLSMKLGQYGLKRVRKNFSWQSIAEKTKEINQTALKVINR
ncbi:glycosyltransferase family 4 protein [Desulfospira joergensenii]|uniref:glycosyltransferase family 4 protein n=1 Tax=Desulfospira joergensenii TaxID=53329 RepID=UPI0003B5EDE5|nr:glycosyltransferase family 4 protein [Desulfospira joergensenii]